MSAKGFQISANFKFVAEVGRQCDSLAETIKVELSKALAAKDAGAEIVAEQWSKVVFRDDESGWVSTDIAYSLPLKVAEEPIGSLCFQISLAGNGMSFGDNREPLLHVCFWTGGPIKFPDNYMGFPLMDEPVVEAGRLLNLSGEEDELKSWTFSLRLISVNGFSDVLSKVVNPAVALLQGRQAAVALPESIEGLALYSLEEPKITFQAE